MVRHRALTKDLLSGADPGLVAPPNKHRLVKVADLGGLMAILYRVEGTGWQVLELQQFGFGYASYYLRLRSTMTVERLQQQAAELARRPYRFGKKLMLGRELQLADDGSIDYVITG